MAKRKGSKTKQKVLGMRDQAIFFFTLNAVGKKKCVEIKSCLEMAFWWHFAQSQEKIPKKSHFFGTIKTGVFFTKKKRGKLYTQKKKKDFRRK